MARSTKAKTAKAAAPYVRRLVEDERVHGHLRDAGTSIRRAAQAVRQPPEPKRGGRKLLLIALAGAGAAVAFKRGGREKLEAAFSGRSSDAEQDAPAGGAAPPPPDSKAAPVG